MNVNDYEIDLQTPSGVRRLCINARVIDYVEAERKLLLVAITDITDARARDLERDDLVREKGVLLQELQHRVANSLQIVASVLMQSARKTQSEELRGHLKDAHLRVLSVAEVQKQLAVSSLDDVALRPYLQQLCASIGASMIYDHDQLAITVEVDTRCVAPETSVSLGLIVTELVINALKHAFPDQRHGVIDVTYRADSKGWTLAVSDDGIGMPSGANGSATAGLGTTIVLALSKQLHARIDVTDNDPGTRVAVSKAALRLTDAANDLNEVKAV